MEEKRPSEVALKMGVNMAALTVLGLAVYDKIKDQLKNKTMEEKKQTNDAAITFNNPSPSKGNTLNVTGSNNNITIIENQHNDKSAVDALKSLSGEQERKSEMQGKLLEYGKNLIENLIENFAKKPASHPAPAPKAKRKYTKRKTKTKNKK